MIPIVVTIQLDLTPAAAALMQSVVAALSGRSAPAPAAVMPAGNFSVGERPRAPPPPELANTSPAPTSPAPDPAPPPADKQSSAVMLDGFASWSPRREALLQQLWPTTASKPDVFKALNALPGRPLTYKAVTEKAYKLGLRRGAPGELAQPNVYTTEVLFEAVQPDPVHPPLPAPQPSCDTTTSVAPTEPAAVVQVDYATAFLWAGQRGLGSMRDGMDIAAVNRKRVELGLLPFELPATPRRGPHFGGTHG